MSAHLTEQEMKRREMDLCEYMCSLGEVHSLECEQYREAHAALRAEREETERLRRKNALVVGVEANTSKILCDYYAAFYGEARDPEATHTTDHALVLLWRVEKERKADRRLLERCRNWITWVRLDRRDINEYRTLSRDLDARLGDSEETGT